MKYGETTNGNLELQMLDETVRRWLADHLTLDDVLQTYEEVHPSHPGAVWKAAAELGWLSVLIDEGHGGMGLGLSEAVVVLRALGYGMAPGPQLSTIVAAEAIRLSDDRAVQDRWLPSLARGEEVASFAGARPQATVPQVDAADRITGSLGSVPFAYLSTVIVVVALQADGRSIWAIDRSADGITVEPTRSLDGTVSMSLVKAHRAQAIRIGGPPVYDRWMAHGALLTAADLLGAGERAVEETVKYVNHRVQFGRPVGSFQAVKHALVDAYVGLTMAAKGVVAAAAALGADHDDGPYLASVAKAKAGEAATAAAAGAIQFHGAMGYTWNNPAHVLFKRVSRQCYEFGDSAWHHHRVVNRWLGGGL
jgi:acyl-CoA dehydrogenase